MKEIEEFIFEHLGFIFGGGVWNGIFKFNLVFLAATCPQNWPDVLLWFFPQSAHCPFQISQNKLSDTRACFALITFHVMNVAMGT